MKTVLAIVALSFSASAANLTQEPASFAVARSDLRNQYAVLSWKLPADVTNTVIYRAYGEGGPWTEIAETNDLATTYTDETAPLGVPCWYKIAFAARDEENVAEKVRVYRSVTVDLLDTNKPDSNPQRPERA